MKSVALSADHKRQREAMISLVMEISHGDEDKITACIRSALERGWTSSFGDILMEARTKKEFEIEKLCDRHYNEFLSSIQDVAHLKNCCSDIAKQLRIVHRDFGNTGSELLTALYSLDKLNNERAALVKTLEGVAHCRDIASAMVQLQQQIHDDDYYGALRSIKILREEQSNPLTVPLASCLERFLETQTDRLLNCMKEQMLELLSRLRFIIIDQCSLLLTVL